ncbi:MAG: HAD-IA family hydrolase [Ignavibacteriaceae bacterium]
MKSRYSVIVFDLGNVLLPFNYNIMLDKLDKIEKNLGQRFLKFYRENYNIHRAFEKGELSEDEFINIMLECLDYKLDRETFCNYYSKIFIENKDVTALLPGFKEKYMLVLLSNTNSIHKEYGWKDFNFIKYFDKLILSHEVRAYKPEEEIYKAVQNFTQKPSGEHIFIDDVQEYSDAAKKLGWDAIHFTDYENLIKHFKERGVY